MAAAARLARDGGAASQAQRLLIPRLSFAQQSASRAGLRQRQMVEIVKRGHAGPVCSYGRAELVPDGAQEDKLFGLIGRSRLPGIGQLISHRRRRSQDRG